MTGLFYLESLLDNFCLQTRPSVTQHVCDPLIEMLHLDCERHVDSFLNSSYVSGSAFMQRSRNAIGVSWRHCSQSQHGCMMLKRPC